MVFIERHAKGEGISMEKWAKARHNETGAPVNLLQAKKLSLDFRKHFYVVQTLNNFKSINLIVWSKKVKYSYPRNKPWRNIGLWDFKDPTLSRQSAQS
jgi:hypothetical protein